MDEKFEKIWELAEPYQDKRNDEGHAKTVLDIAENLLNYIKADMNVVIPAAILHDIGWSKIPKEDRMKIFSSTVTDDEKLDLRIKHEAEGTILARQILESINYPEEYIKQITFIVNGHDTSKIFRSYEDGVVRDADKISIFSKIGVKSDIKIRQLSPKKYLEILEYKLKNKYKFCFTESREIAEQELADRKNEYGC